MSQCHLHTGDQLCREEGAALWEFPLAALSGDESPPVLAVLHPRCPMACMGWVQLGAPGLWGALGRGPSPLPIVGSASFHLWLACGRLDEKGN